MSFILEALRKSENERRAAGQARGTPGGVFVVDAPRKSQLKALALPAVGLAIGAGLAVVWLSPGAPTGGDLPKAPPSTVVAAAPTAMPQLAMPQVETPQVETPQAETPQAETPKAETPKAETPKAETPKAETPKAATPKAATPKAAAPKAAIAKTVTPRVAKPPIAMAPAARPVTAAPVPVATAPVPVATAPVPVAAVPAPVAAAPVAPPAAKPAAVIDEPPRLTISGYANAEDSEERFAVIDNRIVREGEMFAPDLRLVKVGPDGVVVEYKGVRYHP